MSGDLASNWDNFRAEFEDYVLATGLQDKAKRYRQRLCEESWAVDAVTYTNTT